ncbi:MAG TPA: isochorismatase family cysteine hydrolase [Patescibacteria group bacterium]|jgi:nicotinamidase-related amidase
MKTALIVIDVQNYFVNDRTARVPGKIADHIRLRKPELAFFTRFINKESSQFVKMLNWRECMSSPDVDLSPEIKAFAGEPNTFDKTGFSIFRSKSLTSRLKEENVTHVQLCGIDIDACVLASAYEAFDRGYRVEVLDGISGSHHGEDLGRAAVDIINRNLRSKSEPRQ